MSGSGRSASAGSRRWTRPGWTFKWFRSPRPGLHSLPADEATGLQVETNDRIAELVKAHPDRFQGFATLATPAPDAAAQELERAVTKLGLNGALLFGRTGERNLDHPDNWPIFEAAAALRAPLYIHPQVPQPGTGGAVLRF